MPKAILIVALIATPGAFVYSVAYFPRFLRLLGEVAERVHPARQVPPGPPIEQLVADLRRISAKVDSLVAAGPIPGRILKVRSTTAAYDETLLLACRSLEVEPGGRALPMTAEQRLTTEAALTHAGLRW
ncbi:MAG: hypothetical protein WCB04_11980 [Mycobacteriales bacterium]